MPFGLGIVSMLTNIANNRAQQSMNLQNAATQRYINQQNLSFAEKWNQTNYDFAKQESEYQRWLNAEQMKREDNAMSRQIADLEKNGINKLMALGGSGAGAGGMSSYSGGTGANQSANQQAWQGQANKWDIQSSPQILGVIQGIKESNANIERTRADTELTKAQTEHENSRKVNTEMNTILQRLQGDLTAENIKKIQEEINLKKQEWEANNHDLEYARRWELPVGVDHRVSNPWETVSGLIGIIAGKMGVKPEKTPEEITKETENKNKNKAKENKAYRIVKDGKGKVKIYDPSGTQIFQGHSTDDAIKYLEKNKISKKLWEWS